MPQEGSYSTSMMNKTVLSLPIFLLAAGLQAQTVETIPYRAVLLATNEPTPVVDTNAKGKATVWLHLIRDASGKVIQGCVDFVASYQFSGPETITLAHIHKGPAGVSGSVVIGDPIARFDDATGVGTLTTNQVQFSANDSTTPALATLNSILSAPP